MKILSVVAALLLVGIFTSAVAHAGTYSCSANANPDRGFNAAFNISITPAAVGGQIVLKAGNQQKVLGTVIDVGAINGSDPALKSAFDYTIGLIGEEDVSGIASSDLNRVKSIEVFRAETADGDEVLVFKLFDKSRQIGGTVMISGMGTSCLP